MIRGQIWDRMRWMIPILTGQVQQKIITVSNTDVHNDWNYEMIKKVVTQNTRGWTSDKKTKMTIKLMTENKIDAFCVQDTRDRKLQKINQRLPNLPPQYWSEEENQQWGRNMAGIAIILLLHFTNSWADREPTTCGDGKGRGIWKEVYSNWVKIPKIWLQRRKD